MQGYAVTNMWNFFPQFLRIKRLQGYQGYWGYKGYDSHQGVFSSTNARLRGYEVTNLWMNMNLFETFEHSSQVTRLPGFEGYMVTELQNPPHQGVLSSSNLRLRGYRVTNRLNFFLQIF